MAYSRQDIIRGKKSNILVSGNAPTEDKPKVLRTLSEAEQKNKDIIWAIWQRYHQIWNSMIKNRNWEEEVKNIYEWTDESVKEAQQKLKDCIRSDKIFAQEREEYKWYKSPPEPEKPPYSKKQYF